MKKSPQELHLLYEVFQHSWFKVFTLIFFVIVLTTSLVGAFYVHLNWDMGYYLSVSNLIYQGMIPFRDFHLPYAPLSFYLLAFFQFINGGIFSGAQGLLLIFGINTVNSLFFIYVLRQTGIGFYLALAVGTLYLMLVFVADGRFYSLEPFACLPAYLALVISLHKPRFSWVIPGVLLGLSFLMKQYAIGFFPVFILGMAVFHRGTSWNMIKPTLGLVMGFTISLGLAGWFFYFQTGNLDFINQLKGSGYGQKNISTYWLGMKGLIFVLLPVLAFLSYAIFYMTKSQLKMVGVCAFGVLIFSVQFFYEIWPHYQIFIFPFILFLLAHVLQYQRFSKAMLLFPLAFFSITAFSFFSTASHTIQSKWRKNQNRIVEDLRTIIPDDKRVCLFRSDEMATAYLFSELRLLPVDFMKNRFGFETPKENKRLMKKADFVIIGPSQFQKFQESDPEFSDLINHFSMVYGGMVLVFERKR